MKCGLLIETSTRVCSAGIYKNGDLVAKKIIDTAAYVHAESLLPSIQEVIQTAGILTSDLDGVVIGEGPGSYTGLRIGTSLAKGICFGLNTPLYAVDSGIMFAVYAKKHFPAKTCFVSMSDAGRMEVYMAVYDGNLNCVSEHEPIILDEEFFRQDKFRDAVFVGDGISKASHWAGGGQELIVSQTDVSMISLVLNSRSLAPKNISDYVPIYVKQYTPGVAKKML